MCVCVKLTFGLNFDFVCVCVFVNFDFVCVCVCFLEIALVKSVEVP